MHILSQVTDNFPSWINGRERMTVEKTSWSISTKECCRTGAVNSRPPDHQSSAHPTELPSPAMYFVKNARQRDWAIITCQILFKQWADICQKKTCFWNFTCVLCMLTVETDVCKHDVVLLQVLYLFIYFASHVKSYMHSCIAQSKARGPDDLHPSIIGCISSGPLALNGAMHECV